MTWPSPLYAENESDALHAGYVHASERLWQMDLLRRAGGGELSALLGEDMVSNDQYLRTLGMREAADRVAEFLADGPQRIKDGMAAYLAGVNRFIEEDRPLNTSSSARAPSRSTPTTSTAPRASWYTASPST